ncbi:YHS domain-containing protein [Desulfosarcina ovata]|uniref:TRASH domain-containing protein n=2 Tax=Desulfosarcina ovata TaxID=83564 RepID=A0A5K8A940_9BACT|nr:YHS domain-containing protein [Desulfosarcina ovata]BBO81742.1 hypothetical protein DSCO28_23080 [Desulfosarcina ovata subsp. sediminis]BBO88991.1 hypothetical protein DSCOOX_21710 [Desulfosarcina ovata subsp. ovata]
MKLLFLILIVYLAYRAGKSWLKRNLQVPGQGNAAGGAIDDVMVQDPVCGIHFPRREGVELRYDGQVYLFCSAECRDKFLADRGKKT